jgi:hypothetical protein
MPPPTGRIDERFNRLNDYPEAPRHGSAAAEPGWGRCVGRIANALGVTRKEAHGASIRLEAVRGFRRAHGKCAVCGKTRVVTAAEGDGIARRAGAT